MAGSNKSDGTPDVLVYISILDQNSGLSSPEVVAYRGSRCRLTVGHCRRDASLSSKEHDHDQKKRA
jgi:hypothetical protein